VLSKKHHQLFEVIPLGGLAVALVVAALSVFFHFHLALNVKKTGLRAPTPNETVGYGDPTFEAKGSFQGGIPSNGNNSSENPLDCRDPFHSSGACNGGWQDPTLAKAQAVYQAAMQNAQTGNIRYSVPPEMTVKEPETVVVRIYGPHASKQQKQDSTEVVLLTLRS
jgi:hypothetical protein